MSEHDNCHVDPVEKNFDLQAIEAAESATLLVEGMGCPNCATRVRNSLLRLNGVLAAYVHLEQGLAVAAYDPEMVTSKDLIQAVTHAGNDGRHHYFAQIIKQVPVIQTIGR